MVFVPTQYAPIMKIPRQLNVYPTYKICFHYHTTKIEYCVPCLHNMAPLSYYQGRILYTLPTQYYPIIALPR